MATKAKAIDDPSEASTRGGSLPSAMDAWVGTRIKMRRLVVGVKAQWLADQIGVSRQQLVKFEAGEHRITAGRLWDVAMALDIDAGWFFRDYPGGQGALLPDEAAGASMDALKVLGDDAAVVLDCWARMAPDQRNASRLVISAFASQTAAAVDKD